MATASHSFDPYAVLQILRDAEQEVVNAAFKALRPWWAEQPPY